MKDNKYFDPDWYESDWPEEDPLLDQYGDREAFIQDILNNFKDITRSDLQGIVEARCFVTGENDDELLDEIEARYNSMLESVSESMSSDIVTEEDILYFFWEKNLLYFEYDQDDLGDIEVYLEADSYPSGWDPATDSIIYTSTPAIHGCLKRYTYDLERNDDKCLELIQKYLNKDLSLITKQDLNNIDIKHLSDFCFEELLDTAIAEAKELVDSGNYDDNDIDWQANDGYWNDYED